MAFGTIVEQTRKAMTSSSPRSRCRRGNQPILSPISCIIGAFLFSFLRNQPIFVNSAGSNHKESTTLGNFGGCTRNRWTDHSTLIKWQQITKVLRILRQLTQQRIDGS